MKMTQYAHIASMNGQIQPHTRRAHTQNILYLQKNNNNNNSFCIKWHMHVHFSIYNSHSKMCIFILYYY